MTNKYDQFDSKWDFPRYSGNPTFLVLATTPRSGSHMLGHLLRETNQFGYPLEYFHPTNFSKWQELAGTTNPRETLEFLIERRTSPNGIFAVKLHYDHIVRLGGIGFLRDLFPRARYVQLIRKDAVAQAVSRAIARASSKWIALKDQPADAIEKPRLQFDWKLVDSCLKDNLLSEAAWRYALSVLNGPRIELTLEQLVEDQSTTIHQIALLMSIELEESAITQQPPTGRQHTKLNEEWRNLYLQEQPVFGIDIKTKVQPSFAYRLRNFLPLLTKRPKQ